jgi:hypothetical protein
MAPTDAGALAGARKVHKVYPLSSVALYNGVTLAHYLLGAVGVIIGYSRWPLLGWILGLTYVGFAIVQMWVLMPIQVCPSCVYRRMDGSRCISALNLLSARIAPLADEDEFPERGNGVLCHNNLYLAALIAPLVLMVPALILDFSWLVLAILFVVGVLLVFRMMVLFPRVACGHCAARRRCPNAQAMGIG